MTVPAGSVPPQPDTPAHPVRSAAVTVCVLLWIGILVGGAVGLVAVKVFDLVPLHAITSQGSSSGSGSPGSTTP